MAAPRIRDFEVGGNLVDDPQRIQTPNGRNLTTFTLAENTYTRDQEGNRIKGDTVYYDVAIDADQRSNGNLAKNVADSFSKGDYVNVKGNYSAEAYIHQESGQAQVGHRIWATDVAPSLKFASVTVQQNNPQAQANAQAQMDQGAQVQQGMSQPPLAGHQQVNHEQAAQQQAMAPDAGGPGMA